MKKGLKGICALTLASLMVAGTITGCSSASNSSGTSSASANHIYFLNFKPEVAAKYTEIANEYKKETGVTVKVVTAASNTYEQTLRSEIAKSDPPSIFQINGPVGYQNWKDYCSDLSSTKLYSNLVDKNYSVKSGSGVYGIAYAIEGYGIIYNDAIMKKYFALPNKAVSISSTTDIKNFATLKQVVEDMTKNKAALGIDGVFASTSLKSGEDWRWQTHLLNLPIYYEMKDKDSSASTVVTGMKQSEVAFKFGNNYKNIFDLYLNNSCTDSKLLSSKSVDDSMAEFATGKVAMVQNGDWAWSQVSGIKGNVVNSNDIHFLPIYTGVNGEENQGICIGTENYLAINSKVSAAEQKASIAFLDWLFSNDKGKKYVTNDLGFNAPFTTFSDSEKPTDPLAIEVNKWQAKTDVKNVEWTFQCFPSQNFKNDVGAALLQYTQGKKTWDDVASTVKNSWKTEKANSNS